MSVATDTQRNKLMHLENSLIMYGVYNTEALSKLVKMAQVLHSCQSLVEQLFAGQQVAAYQIYSRMQDACSVQHYVTNALLHLHTIKEKYIVVYNKFITQLQIYAKAVRILAKGVFTNFSSNTLQVTRNSKFSEGNSYQKQFRL